MPYGHVAVVIEVLHSAIGITEQNFYFHYWPYRYARQIPLIFRNGLYYINDQYEVYERIEIDDNTQLQLLDQVAAAKLQTRKEELLDSSSSWFHTNVHIYLLFTSHLMFN